MVGITISILGAAIMIIGSMDSSPTLGLFEVANPKVLKLLLGFAVWGGGFWLTALHEYKAKNHHGC